MRRLTVLIAFAIVGFFLGIGAYYLGKNLSPWLQVITPPLVAADWVIAGLIGALVTVILIVVWSYSSARD